MNMLKKSTGYLFGAMTLLTLITAPVTSVAKNNYSANIEMFAPENGHSVGIGGRGWFVDLEIEFSVPFQTGIILYLRC